MILPPLVFPSAPLPGSACLLSLCAWHDFYLVELLVLFVPHTLAPVLPPGGRNWQPIFP